VETVQLGVAFVLCVGSLWLLWGAVKARREAAGLLDRVSDTLEKSKQILAEIHSTTAKATELRADAIRLLAEADQLVAGVREEEM
jgi:hypothetical protein